MKKILFCILHGKINYERYYNISETWAKDCDYIFYSDYEDLNKNIYKVSNKTHYNSNEEKHVNIIKKLKSEYENYEWYFFCDDDTFVNVDNLNKILDGLDTNLVYGSVLNHYPQDSSLYYLSGGAGYLISKQILSILSPKIQLENTGYSDVTLGIWLRKLNIPIKNIDYFRSQPPKFYDINCNDLKNFITFHYIKTKKDMINLLNSVKL